MVYTACFCDTLLQDRATKGDMEAGMNSRLMTSILNLISLLAPGKAQSLPEYALAVTAVGLGCVAGMGYVATSINQVFLTISTVLSTPAQ